MGDAVLFLCGGGAARVADMSRVSPTFPLPIYRVNPREAVIASDPEKATPLASGNPDEIRSRLEGMRVAFVFAMLGGDSGTVMLPEVVSLAREAGCKVVSVVSLPWGVEVDRRARAMDALDGIMGASDRTLLMDFDTMAAMSLDRRGDPKADSFFRVAARALWFAIDSLARMVEGPFFSTFTQRVYTFAYANEIDPAEAVKIALDSTVFETDPARGKAIVAVSSTFGTARREIVFDTIAGDTGIIPDMVSREDRDDTKVLVFLPVAPPSPRASRA